MRLLACLIVFLAALVPPAGAQTPRVEDGAVLPGIDVLAARNFDILRGQRIGLVTNQTGRSRDGRATIDILRAAPGVKLVALYAPEHGVRGEATAGAHVKSYRDKATNLPVYSLYGATRQPTAAMLRGVQTLVFDIQDIGSRSYTFIATMSECMKACAEHKIRLVVLDRPNPVGGAVEGNIPREFSFVCPLPVAYRHGLTMGELARWLNAKRGGAGKGGCALTVVPMQNYRRSMAWDDTGLPWTRTSPNIPRSTSPFFYAATGIIGELPALSIGIGTPWQFEVAGAPGLDARALESELKKRNLPGLDFRAASWKPSQGVHAGKVCNGVQIVLVDPQRAPLTRLNFELYDAVRRIAPQLNFWNSASHNAMFDKVCGTSQIRRMMQSGKSSAEVWATWNAGAIAFAKESLAARLYDD
jgi:uncharacterized protein YbbC (DUF1343 family)